jgi:hypothetical protein
MASIQIPTKDVMKLIQTYQGYFQEDGRFVSENLAIQIPTKRRAIVNILVDEIIEDKTTASEKQKHALQCLYSGLGMINDEYFDEEFDAIMSQRFNIVRDLDL